jgi:hypothetical protein
MAAPEVTVATIGALCVDNVQLTGALNLIPDCG